MLNVTFTTSLETTTGFTLGTSQLNTGVLGYLETPLNAPIRSASWKRGRDSILDSFSAGSASIVFDNRDRLLDPVNTSSPLYGELYPGRKMSLFMVQGSNSAQVFSGYVDSWEYDYSMGGDATVTVNLLDAFSYLANQTIGSISAPEELSGARVSRVLSSINWPVSKQLIDTGYSLLAAETITGGTVLEYLSKVAQSEFGMFFIDRQGTLVFRQRNRVAIPSDLVIQNTPNSESSYVEDIQFEYSFDRVFNEVTLTNDALPASATASDSVSSLKYGERVASYDVLISSSTQMTSVAQGLVGLYGEPQFLARNATVNLDNFNLFESEISNKPLVRQRTIDIGYMTSVYWTPVGSVGGADPIDLPALIITGVSYACSPGSFIVSLQLDYAVGVDALMLDDPSNGRLDYGKLGV